MGRTNYQYLPLTESTIQTPRTDNQRYDAKQRLRHTLLNGWSIWSSLDSDLTQSIFKPVDAPKGHIQPIEKEKIDEARTLHSGIISWLALLYEGVDSAHNLFSPESPNHEVEEDGSVVHTPEIHFDFEQMLGQAINKVENRHGRRIVDFSIEVETEPIQDEFWADYDLDDLLARFEDRDPTLTTRELAYLESEGVIGVEEREDYRREVIRSVKQSHSGNSTGQVDLFGSIDESELPDDVDL